MTTADWNIFDRRKKGFVLWAATELEAAPVLVLGKIEQRLDDNGRSTFTFRKLVEQPLSETNPVDTPHLWELPLTDLNTGLDSLAGVCHYWFRVRDGKILPTGNDILVTDPFATAVDYRLVEERDDILAKDSEGQLIKDGDGKPVKERDGIYQPASVIRINSAQKQLQACDPRGAVLEDVEIDSNVKLAANSELVIYELPTAWTKASSSDKKARETGTFKDVLALLKEREPGTNFSSVDAVSGGAIIAELGINALELLPVTDSKTRGEWGYAPAHYFAPDADLGGPTNTAHSASTDFAALSQHCLKKGIRLINDTVMAFGHDPFAYTCFNTFHLQPKPKYEDNHNPDVFQSGGQGLRAAFGGNSWRYLRYIKTYNPQGGKDALLGPARVFHRAHLAWWMHRFKLSGFRLDSLNNIGNWDFIREWYSDAYGHFRNVHPGRSDEHFLVIGEELSMPLGMIQDSPKCVDALWNERFRERVRAVIVGQAFGDNWNWTVKKMIDCTEDNFGWDEGKKDWKYHFQSGKEAINYITSHDTEGDRKDRLWNYLDDWGITQHKDKAQRCILAFTCLLTSVGIPMIFAGEEFCDEGDNAFVHPYKQRDPVNWERLKGDENKWRKELFECVARLVDLRKSEPALTNLKKGSTSFIYHNEDGGRQVWAWVRGKDPKPKVVVVVNFSDVDFSNAEYEINSFPDSRGLGWKEVITGKPAPNAGKEPLKPWDAKVYAVARGQQP